MATGEMLKFGYKLAQGLRAAGHGSPALVELSDNKRGFGIRYEPTHEELFQASRGKKRKCVGQGMSVPYIRATFPALAKVIMLDPVKEFHDEESDLACII